jgi:hypothetical protein
VKGAFFDAYSASCAKRFHYYWFVVFEAYGFYAASHDGAKLVAKLVAVFRFASVRIQHGDSSHDQPVSNMLIAFRL